MFNGLIFTISFDYKVHKIDGCGKVMVFKNQIGSVGSTGNQII